MPFVITACCFSVGGAVLFISFHLQRTSWAGERLRFNPSPYVFLFLSSTYTPRAHCIARRASRFCPSSSIIADEPRCSDCLALLAPCSSRTASARPAPPRPHTDALLFFLACPARAQPLGDLPQGAFPRPTRTLRLFLYLIIALGNFPFSIFIIFVVRTCALLERLLRYISLLDGQYDDADGLLDSLDTLDARWIARPGARTHFDS